VGQGECECKYFCVGRPKVWLSLGGLGKGWKARLYRRNASSEARLGGKHFALWECIWGTIISKEGDLLIVGFLG
jgi:hypothetical protein